MSTPQSCDDSTETAVPAAPPHAAMRSPQAGEVLWTSGFWADRIALARDAMIPSQRAALADPSNAAYFGNFDAAANRVERHKHHGVDWSDGDCYKYLEALILLSERFPDAGFGDEIERGVASIAAAQDPDGYISTNIQLQPERGRFTDTHNHELYNMGHLLTAASTHFAVTGRRNFLEVAIGVADFLHETFGPRPVELAHYGWNPSNIMGLVDLYRVTGTTRYLRLAETFVDMRGSEPTGSDQNQDHIPFRQERRAVGHAVTGPYLYAGATDIAAETGDGELLDASRRIWENAIGRRMYVTGGIGSHHDSATPRKDRVWEAFGLDYELPNATAYNETCANWALAMWSHRLGEVTGSGRYADVVERVIYNAGLSGVSTDGHAFCYTNPLRWHGSDHELLSNDAPERWERFVCYCCPVQVTRRLARLHEWFYGIGDDTIWVHQYGGSRLVTHLGDRRSVELTQTTDMPWGGNARFRVDATAGGVFTIRCRVPEWTRTFHVELNGEEVGVDGCVDDEGYVGVRREWAPGDELAIDLPVDVSLTSAHDRVESARNHVAVTRGPIVYCLESADVSDGTSIWDCYIDPDTTWKIVANDQPGGVHLLDGSLTEVTRPGRDGSLYAPLAPASTREVPVRLTPYFAWGNRQPGEMSVWFPLVQSRSGR